MVKSRAFLVAVAALAFASCSSNGGADSGVCAGQLASCATTADCCTGLTCENLSCELLGSNNGGSTSGGTGSSGTSAGTSGGNGGSTGNSGGTTGAGGTSGGSSGGFTGPCNCSGTAPYCDDVGRCVACTNDGQCLDAGGVANGTPFCVTTDTADFAYGSCVQCDTTAECGPQGGGVCDPAVHQCDTSGNCIDGGAGYCATSQNGEPICDPTSGECVACETNADCGGSICDPGTKSCVDCLVPTDCSFANAGCFGGFCGSCGYNGDCLPNELCNIGGFPACVCTGASGCGGSSPVCELSDGGLGDAGLIGVCGCEQDQDCGTGNVCVGDQAGSIGTCELNCTLDAGFCAIQSQQGGDTPACDTATGQCIVCVANTDCSSNDNGTYCIDGGMGNECVQCLADGDCADAGGGAFCSQNSCVPCLTDANCAALLAADAGVAGPYCESNFCVQCNADTQCAALDAGTPYCSTSFACVMCTQPSQCPSTAVGCNFGTCGSCSGNTDCPPGDGCQFGAGSSLGAPYCAGLCGFPGAPTDGGCVQCFLNSDCGDAGTCNTDAGSCVL